EEIPLTSWRDKEPEEFGVVDWINKITEEKVHAAAEAAGLPVAEEIKLDYTMRDAQWYHQHGNGVEAEELANKQTKEWGLNGSAHFGDLRDARGASPKSAATAVKSSGGPALGERTRIQIRGRAQRGGEGPNRDDGGY